MPPKNSQHPPESNSSSEQDASLLNQRHQNYNTNNIIVDNYDYGNDDETEVEEYIEEVIIEEKEELVEETIVLKLKSLQGMNRDSLDALREKLKMKNELPENENDFLVSLLEDTSIALSDFNTSKPLIILSNGIVLEGKWIHTSNNLAAVGVEKRYRQQQRKVDDDEDSAANTNNTSMNSSQRSSNFSSSQQQYAPSLSQRIRAEMSSQQSNGDDQEQQQQQQQKNEKSGETSGIAFEYVITSSGTPTRVAVFTISPEETMRRQLMLSGD